MRRYPIMSSGAVGLLTLVLATSVGGVLAQPVPSKPSVKAAAFFLDADLPLGERLIQEHRCHDCHARKVGGDGRSIYRPLGRISSPGALLAMVEQCNTELNLGMFPDDVTAVAAVLQRDHYHFK